MKPLGPIPDGFGRAWCRAVLARTSTKRAVGLAWVLVDEAYAHRSRDVELGYMLQSSADDDGRFTERNHTVQLNVVSSARIR